MRRKKKIYGADFVTWVDDEVTIPVPIKFAGIALLIVLSGTAPFLSVASPSFSQTNVAVLETNDISLREAPSAKLRRDIDDGGVEKQPTALRKRCDEVVTVAVGNVDRRFYMNEAQVEEDIVWAVNTWSDAVGKRVLKYDKRSVTKVSLVYDERQAALSKLLNDASKVAVRATSLELLSRRIEAERTEIESALIEYTQRLKDYNAKVDDWNERGGAPDGVYESLVAQEQQLDKEETALLGRSEEFDRTVGKYNSLLEGIEATSSSLERKAEKPVTIGEYQEFNSRLKGIEIYQFQNRNEFRRVLLHELGHLLGLDHIEEDDAVMNAYSADTQNSIPYLTGGDIEYVKSYCAK